MGMFDHVQYVAPCPVCGHTIDEKDWQSKDGPCGLFTIDPSKVDDFYAICDNCETWVDAHVTKQCVVTEISVSAKKGTGKGRKTK